MKKLVFIFFMVAGYVGFAQKQAAQATKTQYNYTVNNVENEQLLQQVVDEISAFKSVSDCKYRMKPEKKTAEITYTFIERPRKGEGDVGNPAPNVKKILLDKGLQYSGFTFNTEKITE
ncbi:MAG TPA: hypothetical protein VKG26_02170 [Bacteroidia bacterium]|nr:hypothetical protein [Bacteroidia bacterium]